VYGQETLYRPERVGRVLIDVAVFLPIP
jgi:hypothetical protein